MDNNQIGVTSVESVELRMRDKLDEHKKETREEVKETKKEIKEEVERINRREEKFEERINKRMELLEAENLELKKHLNNQDARHNHHDAMTAELFRQTHNLSMKIDKVEEKLWNEIKLTQEQVKFLELKVSEIASTMKEEVQEKIKEKELEAEPMDGEKEAVDEMLTGKYSKPSDVTWEVGKYALSTITESILHLGLATFNNYDRNKDQLKDVSVLEGLRRTIVTSLTKDLFKLNNKQSTMLAVVELGIKTLALVGLVSYHFYKANRLTRQTLERVETFLRETEAEMLSILNISTIQQFNKMISDYRNGYYRDYNIDHIEVSGGEVRNELQNVGGNRVPGLGGRSSRMEMVQVKTNAVRTSTRIKDFKQVITGDSPHYDRIVQNRHRVRHFRLNNYIKPDSPKDKSDQLDHYMKLYLAYHEQADFESQAWHGDKEIVKSTFSWLGVAATGIGLPIALTFGALRAVEEYKWRDNKDIIFHEIRRMTTGLNDEAAERLIERRIIIFRLRKHVQNTGSMYVRGILEKYEAKYKYEGLRCPSLNPEDIEQRKKDVDDLLNLYFILTNKGPCDREEYLKTLVMPSQSAKPQNLLSSAVKEALRIGHKALERASKENPTALNEISEEIPDERNEKIKHKTLLRETFPTAPAHVLNSFETVEELFEHLVR